MAQDWQTGVQFPKPCMWLVGNRQFQACPPPAPANGGQNTEDRGRLADHPSPFLLPGLGREGRNSARPLKHERLLQL